MAHECVWSVADVVHNRNNWNLSADAELLNHLQRLSKTIVDKSQSSLELLKSLENHVDQTCMVVANVSNRFRSLSDTQFIENKVQDSPEIEDVEFEQPAAPEIKTTENMTAKLKEALENGLTVLGSHYDIITVSDSESENDEPQEILLKSFNPFVKRKLPFVIGTENFTKFDHLGLVDSSEDEASDSETEESLSGDEEITAKPTFEWRPISIDDDVKRMKTEIIRISSSESDESEIFANRSDERNSTLITETTEPNSFDIHQSQKITTQTPNSFAEHLNAALLNAGAKLPTAVPEFLDPFSPPPFPPKDGGDFSSDDARSESDDSASDLKRNSFGSSTDHFPSKSSTVYARNDFTNTVVDSADSKKVEQTDSFSTEAKSTESSKHSSTDVNTTRQDQQVSASVPPHLVAEPVSILTGPLDKMSRVLAEEFKSKILKRKPLPSVNSNSDESDSKLSSSASLPPTRLSGSRKEDSTAKPVPPIREAATANSSAADGGNDDDIGGVDGSGGFSSVAVSPLPAQQPNNKPAPFAANAAHSSKNSWLYDEDECNEADDEGLSHRPLPSQLSKHARKAESTSADAPPHFADTINSTASHSSMLFEKRAEYASKKSTSTRVETASTKAAATAANVARIEKCDSIFGSDEDDQNDDLLFTSKNPIVSDKQKTNELYDMLFDDSETEDDPIQALVEQNKIQVRAQKAAAAPQIPLLTETVSRCPKSPSLAEVKKKRSDENCADVLETTIERKLECADDVLEITIERKREIADESPAVVDGACRVEKPSFKADTKNDDSSSHPFSYTSRVSEGRLSDEAALENTGGKKLPEKFQATETVANSFERISEPTTHTDMSHISPHSNQIADSMSFDKVDQISQPSQATSEVRLTSPGSDMVTESATMESILKFDSAIHETAPSHVSVGTKPSVERPSSISLLQSNGSNLESIVEKKSSIENSTSSASSLFSNEAQSHNLESTCEPSTRISNLEQRINVSSSSKLLENLSSARKTVSTSPENTSIKSVTVLSSSTKEKLNSIEAVASPQNIINESDSDACRKDTLQNIVPSTGKIKPGKLAAGRGANINIGALLPGSKWSAIAKKEVNSEESVKVEPDNFTDSVSEPLTTVNLSFASKSRAKIPFKRRPPTRHARNTEPVSKTMVAKDADHFVDDDDGNRSAATSNEKANLEKNVADIDETTITSFPAPSAQPHLSEAPAISGTEKSADIRQVRDVDSIFDDIFGKGDDSESVETNIIGDAGTGISSNQFKPNDESRELALADAEHPKSLVTTSGEMTSSASALNIDSRRLRDVVPEKVESLARSAIGAAKQPLTDIRFGGEPSSDTNEPVLQTAQHKQQPDNSSQYSASKDALPAKIRKNAKPSAKIVEHSGKDPLSDLNDDLGMFVETSNSRPNTKKNLFSSSDDDDDDDDNFFFDNPSTHSKSTQKWKNSTEAGSAAKNVKVEFSGKLGGAKKNEPATTKSTTVVSSKTDLFGDDDDADAESGQLFSSVKKPLSKSFHSKKGSLFDDDDDDDENLFRVKTSTTSRRK